MNSDRGADTGKVIKALCTYGLGSVLQSSLTFMLLPLYLSSFTPAEFGVVSIILVVQAIAVMLLGCGVYSVVSRLYYEREKEQRKELAGTCLLWTAFLGGLGSALLYLLATPCAVLLFDSLEYTRHFQLLSGCIFFALIRDFPGVLCRIESRAVHYVLLAIGGVVTDFVFKVLFINSWDRGVEGFLESSIISGVLFFLFAYSSVARMVILRIDLSTVRQLIYLGSPYIISGLSMWTMEFSDRLLIEYYLGASAVGIYSLGYTFAAIFTVTVSRPVALILDPFIFERLAKIKSGLGDMLAHVLTGSLVVGGVAYLMISLCSEELLLLCAFFFKIDLKYFEVLPLVPTLTLIPFLYFLSNPPGIALLWARKTIYLSLVCAACAVLNVLLNIVFIPLLGLQGAAVASILSYGVQAGVLYFIARRVTESRYRWAMNAILLCLLGVSLVLGLLSPFSEFLTAFAFELIVVLVLFLGGSVLCIALYGKGEMDLIYEAISRRKKTFLSKAG